MQLLSKEFEEKILNEINGQVRKTLLHIENNYAVRAEYFNKKNACIYADITAPTLDNWIKKGLKVAKVNGSYCIKKSDLDEFISEYRL